MYGDYSYNGLTGYQYVDFLDTTIYITEEKALTACSNEPKCSVSFSESSLRVENWVEKWASKS